MYGSVTCPHINPFNALCFHSSQTEERQDGVSVYKTFDKQRGTTGEKKKGLNQTKGNKNVADIP